MNSVLYFCYCKLILKINFFSSTQNMEMYFISVDYGGNFTKLVIHYLNTFRPLSVNKSHVLAMYSGVKDNYTTMNSVFGPVFKKLQTLQRHITEFELPSPSTGTNYLRQAFSVECKQCWNARFRHKL